MEPRVDPEDKPQAWYEPDKDRLCYITAGTDRETEYHSALTREADGKPAKLYAIGAWYWTWYEAVENTLVAQRVQADTFAAFSRSLFTKRQLAFPLL